MRELLQHNVSMGKQKKSRRAACSISAMNCSAIGKPSSPGGHHVHHRDALMGNANFVPGV